MASLWLAHTEKDLTLYFSSHNQALVEDNFFIGSDKHEFNAPQIENIFNLVEILWVV